MLDDNGRSVGHSKVYPTVLATLTPREDQELVGYSALQRRIFADEPDIGFAHGNWDWGEGAASVPTEEGGHGC